MIVLDLKNTNLSELNEINRGNLINSKFKNKEEFEQLATAQIPSLFDNRFVESIVQKLQDHLIHEHKQLLINSIYSDKARMKINNYALEFLNYFNFKEKSYEGYSPVTYMNEAVQPLLDFGHLTILLDAIKNETNVTKIHCTNNGIWIHKIDSSPEKLAYNLSVDDFIKIKQQINFYNESILNRSELIGAEFYLSIEDMHDRYSLSFVVTQKKIHTKELHFYNQNIGNNSIYSLIKSSIKANINVAFIGINEVVLSEILNFTINQMNYYKPITVIEHYPKHCTMDIHNNKNIELLTLQDNNISALLNSSKIKTDWLVWNELYVTDPTPVLNYAKNYKTIGVFEKIPTKAFPLLIEVEETFDSNMYQITKISEWVEETGEIRLILEFNSATATYSQHNQFSDSFSKNMSKQITIPALIKHLLKTAEVTTTIVEPITTDTATTTKVEPITNDAATTSIEKEEDFFVFTKKSSNPQERNPIEVQEEVEDDFFLHLKR